VRCYQNYQKVSLVELMDCFFHKWALAPAPGSHYTLMDWAGARLQMEYRIDWRKVMSWSDSVWVEAPNGPFALREELQDLVDFICCAESKFNFFRGEEYHKVIDHLFYLPIYQNYSDYRMSMVFATLLMAMDINFFVRSRLGFLTESYVWRS
jgi:hypothetical protein